MTLFLNRLAPFLVNFLGQFGGNDHRQYLDLNGLSSRDLADLNLPPDLKVTLMAHREVERIRRGM